MVLFFLSQIRSYILHLLFSIAYNFVGSSICMKINVFTSYNAVLGEKLFIALSLLKIAFVTVKFSS